MSNIRETAASELMSRFADRDRRYLWTDAFAVCNYVALGRLDRARHTIERVQTTLGRFRDDDRRIGALPGGLRIGKPLPERGPDEPFDERLEWERDGQYFHYLTKWMHALDVMARATGDADYARDAVELARAAHRGFVYDTGHGKRMYWKMSTDLTRPLVTSMGHHDPLDGLITAVQVAAPRAIVDDYRAMIDPARLATTDPLGLGGLLVDAARVHQLAQHGAWPADLPLFDALVAGAMVGLRQFARVNDLDGSAHRRLAFRELGLAIGIAAVELLPPGPLATFVPLRHAIEQFWLAPESRRARTWTEHEDINDVMLATSLVPSGFLVLTARDGSARRGAAEPTPPPHTPSRHS